MENEIHIVGKNYQTTVSNTRSSGFSETLQLGKITAERLKEQLTTFINIIGSSVDDQANKLGNYQLEEITVKLELTVSGTLAILGNGASTSGTGGIELKFTIKKPVSTI